MTKVVEFIRRKTEAENRQKSYDSLHVTRVVHIDELTLEEQKKHTENFNKGYDVSFLLDNAVRFYESFLEKHTLPFRIGSYDSKGNLIDHSYDRNSVKNTFSLSGYLKKYHNKKSGVELAANALDELNIVKEGVENENYKQAFIHLARTIPLAKKLTEVIHEVDIISGCERRKSTEKGGKKSKYDEHWTVIEPLIIEHLAKTKKQTRRQLTENIERALSNVGDFKFEINPLSENTVKSWLKRHKKNMGGN